MFDGELTDWGGGASDRLALTSVTTHVAGGTGEGRVSDARRVGTGAASSSGPSPEDLQLPWKRKHFTLVYPVVTCPVHHDTDGPSLPGRKHITHNSTGLHYNTCAAVTRCRVKSS
ncbi:hypothetical protein EYF80_025063 [Liparis tanakae]|uniref:Uncharacterized protein n=1 Tax=Liparis tanakae TaxID=230148 RepID=A0A4Z2HFV4_9TELE|nr:hypothetical protein EYF80_025063 [Liparis tanakae]